MTLVIVLLALTLTFLILCVYFLLRIVQILHERVTWLENQRAGMTAEQVVAWCDREWAKDQWLPPEPDAKGWRRIRYWIADRLQPW